MALSMDRRHLPGGAPGRPHRQRRARHYARTNGAYGSPLAVGVDMDGRREVLGMAIGASEAFGGTGVPWTPAFSAEPFWIDLPHAISFAGAWPA